MQQRTTISQSYFHVVRGMWFYGPMFACADEVHVALLNNQTEIM